jgi:hypothetical protein
LKCASKSFRVLEETAIIESMNRLVNDNMRELKAKGMEYASGTIKGAKSWSVLMTRILLAIND